MKKVKILNVAFDVLTKDEALGRILQVLEYRGHEAGKQIVTPNPEMLVEASRNRAFRDVLNNAWLSIPDGIGILWASTFQNISRNANAFTRWLKALASLISLLVYPSYIKKVFPERLTGTDLMESIVAVSREKKIPIFLLGGRESIAERVKEILGNRYSGVNIVGCFSGTPVDDDFPHIQAMIAETRPQILFVAFGSPQQELWIAKNLPQLKSVKIAVGVGGAFDFIAGEKRRAPHWMRKTGLEWLYRLIQEPLRLKRIWNATIRFPIKVITR